MPRDPDKHLSDEEFLLKRAHLMTPNTLLSFLNPRHVDSSFSWRTERGCIDALIHDDREVLKRYLEESGGEYARLPMAQRNVQIIMAACRSPHGGSGGMDPAMGLRMMGGDPHSRSGDPYGGGGPDPRMMAQMMGAAPRSGMGGPDPRTMAQMMGGSPHGHTDGMSEYDDYEDDEMEHLGMMRPSKGGPDPREMMAQQMMGGHPGMGRPDPRAMMAQQMMGGHSGMGGDPRMMMGGGGGMPDPRMMDPGMMDPRMMGGH